MVLQQRMVSNLSDPKTDLAICDPLNPRAQGAAANMASLTTCGFSYDHVQWYCGKSYNYNASRPQTPQRFRMGPQFLDVFGRVLSWTYLTIWEVICGWIPYLVMTRSIYCSESAWNFTFDCMNLSNPCTWTEKTGWLNWNQMIRAWPPFPQATATIVKPKQIQLSNLQPWGVYDQTNWKKHGEF